MAACCLLGEPGETNLSTLQNGQRARLGGDYPLDGINESICGLWREYVLVCEA